MIKMILILFSYTLFMGAHAESNYKELKISSKEVDEFKRPLPELLVFSPLQKCVYQKYGFDTENNLYLDLDLVFGIPNNSLPSGLSKEKIESIIVGSGHDLTSMSAKEKEDLIESVSEQIKAQTKLLPCDLNFISTVKKFEEYDNKSFKFDSVLNSNFILVEYTADWCEPCKKQSESIKRYLELRKVSINWLKVERDSQKADFGSVVKTVVDSPSISKQ